MALRSKLLDEEVVKSAEKMPEGSKEQRMRLKETKCCNCKQESTV